MLQLADHCSIALNKETLPLLQPLAISVQYNKASVSIRNLAGIYVKMFTGIIISPNTIVQWTYIHDSNSIY